MKNFSSDIRWQCEPVTACSTRDSIRHIMLGAMVVAVPILAQQASAQNDPVLDEVVVTATSRPESRARVVGSIDILDESAIERAAARSLTELLADQGAAFLSEWSPGQTQINIRGGISDGQGRDFRSQVLVLLNGRRAGTANLSKLSPGAVSRIEIVRGPSSVIYGSQNIGGVVNIITKSGLQAEGGSLQLNAGSWGLLQGDGQIGGANGNWDWFVGASAGTRDDYEAGKGGGEQINTHWDRRGGTAALGYQFNSAHRVDLTVRSDGIYDAGFRGGTASYDSEEDRYNRSVDLVYKGATQSERLTWLAQLYAVNDVDDLRWSSPIVRTNNRPAPGTSRDDNRRELDIVGSRVQPHVELWQGNQLLLGWDWERSKVRSTRVREGVNGATLSQIPPYDNNQTEVVHALYFEDAQSFFDERLTVRGGLRHTIGETSFDRTPNLAGQVTSTQDYDATTYAGGFAFRIADGVTWRAGVAKGFRAPNATELGADFTSITGSRTYGNPSLKPESSRQIETGLNVRNADWRADLAIFRNVIMDRITTLARPNVVGVSDYVNNSGDVIIEGAELQLDADLLGLFGSVATGWEWSATVGGSYHWTLEDEGAPASLNTRNAQRVYEYQGSVSSQVGQTSGRRDWLLRIEGVLSGPIWYDPEAAGERLLIPQAQPYPNYVHEKQPFWLWNARAEYQLSRSLRMHLAVNNILDRNYHPIFIGIDKAPHLADPRYSNGGLGTSMPGREFLVGVKFSFGEP